jgi:hypothetical protein
MRLRFPLQNNKSYRGDLTAEQNMPDDIPIGDLALGPFRNKEEIYEYTNQQTSRKFLYHRQSDVGNPSLCLTSFIGGSFYGLSNAQKRLYLTKKAADIDREDDEFIEHGIMSSIDQIIYTDNEFQQHRSKLAFEFDLKSADFLSNWKSEFTTSAKYIVRKVSQAKNKDVICHLLIRPPQRCKDGRWKYGMHLIFENLVVSMRKGSELSKTFRKKIPYIDSVYDGDTARLRPAYARKLIRSDLKECGCFLPPDICACLSCYLSTYYNYYESIECAPGDLPTSKEITFKSTCSMLMATTIWVL